MGLVLWYSLFFPIVFKLSTCPRGSKANGITFASAQFRTWLNQCAVKKRAWSFLGPVILHFGRKVGSFCSLPAPSVFALSGHAFKMCQNWHYPTGTRGLGEYFKAWWKHGSCSSPANACWPEAPCVHVCVRARALFFLKTFGVSFLDTSDVPFSHPQIVRRLPSRVTYCLQWNLTGSDGSSCCKIF